MAYSAITSSEIEVKKPITTDLMTKIKNNDDDSNTRLNSLESGANKISVFNKIVELDTSRVGDIRFSLLSAGQFTDRFGSKWQKIDGSSLSGEGLAALYGANLPDFEERFPRIIGGAKSVGDTEASQNKEHEHTLQYGGLTGTGENKDQIPDYPFTTQQFAPGDYNSYWINAEQDYCFRAAPAGEAEARPDSAVMSAYIKVSDTTLSHALIFNAMSAFALVNLKISNMLAGSASSLSVDLLKGSALDSLTTILNSNLTLAYSEGNYAQSANASFDTTSISQGDFLVLKVNALQTGQDKFFVSCYGEL